MNIEDILNNWYKEASNNKLYILGPVYYHIKDNKLYLLTTWPGILIGLHGKTVKKYQKILKDNNFNYEIEIIELSKYGGIHKI